MELSGNRKLILSTLCVLALVAGCIIGKVDGVVFVSGIVALAGVFVEGNIRSKKILNGGKKK